MFARFLRSFLVWCIGVASAIYLLNPYEGQTEIIPDSRRVLGNLDEFVAGMLFLSFLRYFGVDACSFFPKDESETGP